MVPGRGWGSVGGGVDATDTEGVLERHALHDLAADAVLGARSREVRHQRRPAAFGHTTVPQSNDEPRTIGLSGEGRDGWGRRGGQGVGEGAAVAPALGGVQQQPQRPQRRARPPGVAVPRDGRRRAGGPPAGGPRPLRDTTCQ